MNSPPRKTTQTGSRLHWKLLGLIAGLMLVPIIPFVLAGDLLESAIEAGFRNDFSISTRLMILVVVLLVDIFLPVPSSAVITYAGALCGVFPTTLAAALGLTLGGGLGYELSRLWGTRYLKHHAQQADWQRLLLLNQKFGGISLVLTRPLPILAETAILCVGCLQMRRAAFYPLLVASNLAISLVYALCGYWFSDERYLPWMLLISLFAPLLLTLFVRRLLPAHAEQPASETTEDSADNHED